MPVKLGSFFYGPEQVQTISGAVQAIDLHRASTCQGLLALNPADPSYNSQVLALVQMDAEVTVLNTILQTDPSQFSAWVQRQQNFLQVHISPQERANHPQLRQALQAFQVSNAHPGQRLVGVTENKTHWVLDADVSAGNCVLKAGSYVDVDPAAGRGRYSLTAYTKQTSGTDVWHQRWQVLDGANNVIATFGGEGIVDVGDLKNDHVIKTSTGLVVFQPNAFSGNQAALVAWQGAC